jgi:hypothetical protein
LTILNESALRPNKTTGTLVCLDGTPLSNCVVTVAFYDANGFVSSQKATTSATGSFEVSLGCVNASATGRHFVISAQCCATVWTIPTSCCCGDLGTLVCRSCGCTTPPRITCPTNIVVWTCPGPTGVPPGAVVNYTVSAVDECDPDASVTCNPPSGNFFPAGTTVVNCTARDKSGNISQCEFTVTVNVDTTPPRMTCSTNILVNCDGANSPKVKYTVTAVDDCDPNPVVECHPPSGSTFPAGTTLVTCDSSDKCGNKTSCSFTVKVDPTQATLTATYQSDGTIFLCWPITCRDYKLECRSSFSPTVGWTGVPATPIIMNGRYCVKLPFSPGQNRFYRLVSSAQ